MEKEKLEVLIIFINLQSRLNEKEVQNLIAYSVFPEPKVLEETVDKYMKNQELQMFGLEEKGELIGIIGFKKEQEDITISHLAVKPKYRGLEYGRGLILELINVKKPVKLIAETDEEAVEFYRNNGFVIKSLGEKYPGVERFQCIYEV